MKDHRIFLVVSLALAALAGTLLGLWMILGWLGYVSLAHFSQVLRTHAQLQVYGFVVLFTMGVAMMVLPRFLGTTLRPPGLVVSCLLFMVSGIVCNLSGPSVLGAVLQTLGVAAFVTVIRKTRTSAPKRPSQGGPVQKAHAAFLAAGGLWLLVSPGLAFLDATRSLETVLWGFAGLYIAGIGLRVHPAILALGELREGLLLPSWGLWNLALAVRWVLSGPLWVVLLAVGVGGFLLALSPFRRSRAAMPGTSWIRVFVRTSYLWLVVAVLLALATEIYPGSYVGPARHSLASGYILTMMIGMGFRLIPNFEGKRLLWSSGPWVAYLLITSGGVLRVGGQALNQYPVMGVGGVLQTAAVLLFVVLLLSTMAFGERAEAPPMRRPGYVPVAAS